MLFTTPASEHKRILSLILNNEKLFNKKLKEYKPGDPIIIELTFNQESNIQRLREWILVCNQLKVPPEELVISFSEFMFFDYESNTWLSEPLDEYINYPHLKALCRELMHHSYVIKFHPWLPNYCYIPLELERWVEKLLKDSRNIAFNYPHLWHGFRTMFYARAIPRLTARPNCHLHLLPLEIIREALRRHCPHNFS